MGMRWWIRGGSRDAPCPNFFNFYGHKQCVNAWIEAGADVKSEDEYGFMTLFIDVSV